MLFNGNVYNTVALTRVTGSTFNPSENAIYVAISNSGSDKNKIVRALFSISPSIIEIISSDDYDLYRGVDIPVSQGVDIVLKLSIKDSLNEITVGVPEAAGDTFPVSTDKFPTVFSVN